MIAWCIALVVFTSALTWQATAVPPRVVQGGNVQSSAATSWTTTTNGHDISGGYPSALFDGNTATIGMDDHSRYPVWTIMDFSSFVTLKGFRVWVDSETSEPSNYLVYVDSADSVNGLANTSEHFLKLIWAERTPGGQWMEYPFPCRRAKSYKLTFERLDPAKDVVIREIEPIYMTAPTGSTQDVDVTFIERSPKYNFDASKNRPAPGDTVTYTAHLRNRGSSALTNVQCAWYYDGALVQTNSVSIPLSSETITYDANGKSGPLGVTVTYSRAWAEGVHELKFVADTAGAVAEISEANNTVTIMPTGKMVGLCVQENVLHYFDQHQIELGLGANSWEDWAQRQMDTWSTFMRFNGTRERVYL
jgi:hypothetical protein